LFKKSTSTIEAGSFVKCDHANFLILAGLGKIEFENENIFVISPNAPLAKAMNGKIKENPFFSTGRKWLSKKYIDKQDFRKGMK